MKFYAKVYELDGTRNIYFCGIKIFSYKRPVKKIDFSYYILKYKGVKKAKNLKNLILGSSHGRDGFIPDETDFNLSHSSLDLYRIYYLYKYVVENNGKNLKNIIVFFSVFHAGLQLEKTGTWQNCIIYKTLYDIKYAFPVPLDDSYRIKEIKEQVDNIDCPDDFRGISDNYENKYESDAKNIVDGHVKNTTRNNNQIKYIAKLVEMARKNKQNVYIVLPPYRSDYLKYLPEQHIVFRELFDFLDENKDVKLINLQNDKDFVDSDFNSVDHCGESGGIKLTQKIRNFVK